MSQIQVDEIFQKRMDELAGYALRDATAGTGITSRKWFVSSIQQKEDRPSLTDMEAIRKLFDRSQLNEDFIEALQDPDGTRAATVLSQLQILYLSAMEREFRMRHRSRVRMMAHESIRRLSHGHEAGAIRQGPMRWCQQIPQRSDANAD